MGHPTSFGQPPCLVWLAAAFLVLGLCLVQQGAGILRPHQWKSSEAALSVSPAGDIVDKYSDDSTEGENTVSEEQAEGSRRFWPGRPRPLFTEEDPPDLETNPLYYRGKVPGEEIIQEVFSKMPEFVPNDVADAFAAYENAVSQMLWAQGGVVTVVSELGESDRQLVRGKLINIVAAGLLFEATDQATGEPMTVLVGNTSNKPSGKDLDKLRHQALAVGLFRKVKNPHLAHKYMRFLVPFDLVMIPGKPLIDDARPYGAKGWIVNLLPLVPATQVDVERFVEELCELPTEDRPLVDAARVYLTIQAVRLVAHLQDEGVVHGALMPNSFYAQKQWRRIVKAFRRRKFVGLAEDSFLALGSPG
ncbi:UNVERIFIED_CONTAM: rhoptry protein ROP7 [Hammondia hammondi]|eukprot:XP_008888973.1 rhoptry protein ROP7 [Hammondia hammondi]